MGIHYELLVATEAGPKDATAALRSLIPVASKDMPAEGAAAERSWLPDGPVSITAWRMTGWPCGQAEDNDVSAKLGVDFQLIVEEDYIEAVSIMLRDVLVLLDKIPGDAVFINAGDEALLRRLGGKLELNLAAPFWTPELRSLVTIPHEAHDFSRPLPRIDYTKIASLVGLYLEDSFVLGIKTSRDEVEFALDAVLTPKHPLYHPPRSGEQYCYRKLRLRFPRAFEVDWNNRSRDIRVDASGETDLGHFASLYRSGGCYHLAGDWGSVSIRSDEPVVIDGLE